MTGWARRMSRARPQCGRSSRHSSSIASAGPTSEEQRLPWARARAANAAIASEVAATGTRFAPA